MEMTKKKKTAKRVKRVNTENALAAGTDIRDRITLLMKEEGRKFVWLSEKTGIPMNTLHSILKQKTILLSKENQKKIETVLGTTFQ